MKKCQILMISVPVVLMMIAGLACNFPGSSAPTETPIPTDTPAEAETTAAPPTEASPETETPASTDTPGPTMTVTATEIPCERAAFVSDVTIDDGTDFEPDDAFTKTWRLKNTGSCTWTSGYDLVFDRGDRMGAPDAVQLTSGTVASGENVDVSVQLTAPGSEGTYKGFFKLRSSENKVFGVGNSGDVAFWVEIDVIEPEAPPELVVTDINFNPYPPTSGDAVTVTVTIKNNGGGFSDSFTTHWWAAKTYPSFEHFWTINGMSAGESKNLTYNYPGYPSHYASIVTKAVVDSTTTIDESDNGNNLFEKTIQVDP